MAEDKKANSNIHKGHRQKVREKFYANGFSGMAPHNVLEMLLFFGIPYRDTNPIAHELIDRFGSLSAVFEAKHADLMKVKGMTENAACLITMVLPLYKKYSQDLRKRKTVFGSTDEIVAFLRPLYLDNNNVERIYVLCFDASKRLINYCMLNEGDIVSSSFDMRKFISFVLETNAVFVTISHNHPHGITSPSCEDIGLTKDVAQMLANFKVKLNDHIIITDNSHFSMASSLRFAHIFLNIENPLI